MSAVASRLVSAAGVGGVALVAAGQLESLVPVVLAVAVLGGLLLLLIVVLALAAVYSRDPARRRAAEKILDRLLSAQRPQQCPVSRRKTSTDRPGKDSDYANHVAVDVAGVNDVNEVIGGTPPAVVCGGLVGPHRWMEEAVNEAVWWSFWRGAGCHAGALVSRSAVSPVNSGVRLIDAVRVAE